MGAEGARDMSKKPEPLPIIKNRHYAQGSTARKRCDQRVERVRRGEAGMPPRRWKKGQGWYAPSKFIERNTPPSRATGMVDNVVIYDEPL